MKVLILKISGNRYGEMGTLAVGGPTGKCYKVGNVCTLQLESSTSRHISQKNSCTCAQGDVHTVFSAGEFILEKN